MYHDLVVDVPDVKGKIVRATQGKHTYVYYQIDRQYYPDKGYNSAKRVLIGKIVGDPKNSKMHPNNKYYHYFAPQQREEQAVPAQLPPANKRSDSLNVGTFIVLDKIADEYNLKEGLALACPKFSALHLDLAAYMIIDQSNIAQHYHGYAYNHPLFSKNMHVYSDSTISKLYNTFSQDAQTTFLKWWNSSKDHNQRVYVTYDSTNKSSQAGDLSLAEFGKSKDNKGLPIVNISMLYNQTNQVPLFYEVYPGSINDISQLQYLVNKVEEYGYKHLGFILDRGYFSRANIEYMDAKGFSFLMMVKGCKELVSHLVDEKIGSFENDRRCNIPGTHLHGVTVERQLYEGDTKSRYFHVCYSHIKMAKERSLFCEQLDFMAKELAKHENTVWTVPEAYEIFFDCHYEGKGEKRKFLFAEEKQEVTSVVLNRCGYFCLISSEKMTAQEAYRLYSGRDSTEKLFLADKTFLGSTGMRVGSEAAFRAKLFNEFVALLMRSRFYTLLKEQMFRLKVKRNYLSVPAAIVELEKIQITRVNGGKYILNHALTKNQKEIIQCFGISESDFKARVEALSLLLQNTPDELAEPKETATQTTSPEEIPTTLSAEFDDIDDELGEQVFNMMTDVRLWRGE